MSEVSVAELRALVDADPTVPVIDVRELAEYQAGHVPSAVLLPMSELTSRFHELDDYEGTIYLICRTGARSGQCAAWLEPQGYDVVNVTGGTMDWIDAGYTVEA